MYHSKKIRIRWLTVLTRSLKSSAVMLMFFPLNIQKLESEPNREKASADIPTQQKYYRVLAVGDVMLGSDWPIAVMDPRVSPGAQPSAVLGKQLASLFTDADVVFGNFEGTIHTSPTGAKVCQNLNVCFTFRSPPFHAQYLAKAGFNMMSNANNHARDFGEVARSATYDNLTKSGIAVSAADSDGMR